MAPRIMRISQALYPLSALLVASKPPSALTDGHIGSNLLIALVIRELFSHAEIAHWSACENHSQCWPMHT
jgi:hypothetical protein